MWQGHLGCKWNVKQAIAAEEKLILPESGLRSLYGFSESSDGLTPTKEHFESSELDSSFWSGIWRVCTALTSVTVAEASATQALIVL